jgi:trk system potassium uptake protein TrkH
MFNSLLRFKWLGLSFLLFWGGHILAPGYLGKGGVQLVALGLFSYFLFRQCCRRSFSPLIRWARWSFFTLGALYFLLLARSAFLNPDLVLEFTTHQWNSWIQAWTILNFFILVLSSPQWVRQMTKLQSHPARFIVSIYSASALICSLFLVLPVSLQGERQLSFLDAIFVSVSAISGAGLSPLNIAETFSRFGHLIILLFIQAGGIGIITFSGILLLIIGRELGVHNKIIQDDTEKLYFLGSVRRFAAFVALFMVIVETIGVILIYPWMAEIFEQPSDALFHSLFHVVSAICTAGLSTLPRGIEDFNSHPAPLAILSVVAFVGALGAPTIIQLVQYFDWRSPLRKISAYAKLELSIGIFFVVAGGLVLMAFEWTNPFHQSWDSVVTHSFTQSFMRTAGFNSMPIDAYSLPGQISLLNLMLIGGAPISTAGGIKTGTLAIIVLFILSFLRNSSDASFAGRRIPSILFTKAVSIAFIYGLVGLGGFLLLYLTQKNESAFALLFESFSALGVCGWTIGVTSDLNAIGKAFVICLMMIGRIGVLTALYFFIIKGRRRNYQYAQGEFYVG